MVIVFLLMSFVWGIIGVVLGAYFQRRAFAIDERYLNSYRTTYLWKCGWTEGFGSYQLVSLDGGRNWYAVERDGDAVTVKGAAEAIFPGLLARLRGMEELTKYITEHGQVTLSGKRAAEDRAMLEGAGFTVGKKS